MIKRILTLALVIYALVATYFLWQYRRESDLEKCLQVPWERLTQEDWQQVWQKIQVGEMINRGRQLIESGQKVASSAAQINEEVKAIKSEVQIF